jgi:serine/threonine protein kinase
MTIAKGTARGLAYLHDDMGTIHGNLTGSNVLLDDEQCNPKISDCGLSRLMTAAANSNVLAAAGALGYRAPELSKLKKASAKTDVYSLGVVVLELLTGKSPADSTNGMDLPQWVASIVKEEWTSEVFDLELMRDAAAAGSVGDELMDTLKLALHCVDPSPSVRPDAREVLRQLEQIRPGSGGAALSEDAPPVSAGGDDDE